MKRKIITIEVETEATNADIRRAMAGDLPAKGVPIGMKKDGTEVEGTVYQVTVNDVTTPKKKEKKQ